MTSDTQKWIALVAKLLEGTQTGEIVWAENVQTIPTPFRSFSTTYLGQGLRLDEVELGQAAKPLGIFGQSTGIRAALSLIDERGRVNYRAPLIEGLNHLFDAVLRRRANVDEFLNRALAGE